MIEDEGTTRCADWALANAVDPIGTAGSFRGVLLVEWPLPWPADVGTVPALAPIAEVAASMGYRMQAVAPAGRSAPDPRAHVILYRAPAGRSTHVGFERVEVRVAPDQVSDAAHELLTSGAPPSAPAASSVTDILICSHGQRDRCCGRLGTVLHSAMTASSPMFLGARVWRTSHLGGHRFAPTAMLLPQGTVWANADAALFEQIIRRSGDARELLGRYRGCIALPSPLEQAAERVAFADVGWSWLDHERSTDVRADAVIRVEGVSPTGEVLRWTTHVITRRLLPVPACGAATQQTSKVEAELEVAAWRRGD